MWGYNLLWKNSWVSFGKNIDLDNIIVNGHSMGATSTILGSLKDTATLVGTFVSGTKYENTLTINRNDDNVQFDKVDIIIPKSKIFSNIYSSF